MIDIKKNDNNRLKVDCFSYKSNGIKEGKRIDYSVTNEDGREKELGDEQKVLIQRVINEQMRMDPSKDHRMRVKILKGDDQFSLVIDEKTTFFVSKTMIRGQEKIAVVRDRLKKRGFLDSSKSLLTSILSFFYRPFCPNPQLKKRDFRKGIQEDYQSLCNSLEWGKKWLTREEGIQLTSEKDQKREQLEGDVASAISHAKKIEKALKEKRQQEALEGVAAQFAKEIFGMGVGASQVIPMGYRTQEGVMQPLFLRFKRDENTQLSLEIFCDTAEGEAKIAPTQLRTFKEDTADVDTIKTLLNIAFQPLVAREDARQKLLDAAQPSRILEQAYKKFDQKAIDEMFDPLEARKMKQGEEAAPERKKEETLTYNSLIHSLDREMEGKWKDSTAPINEQGLIRQPTTPAARVVKWFDRIIDDRNNRFTSNEKLDLLFFLTNEWVDEQRRQIGPKTSPSAQLDIYQKCLSQLTHVKGKIARCLNNGHSLNDKNLPDSLKEREQLCRKKIETLEKKKLQRTTELRREKWQKKQRKDLAITLPPIGDSAPRVAAAADTLDQVKWGKAWKGEMGKFKTLLNPQNLRRQQKQQVIRQFDPLIEALRENYSRQLDAGELTAEEKAAIHTNIKRLQKPLTEQLFSDGTFDRKALSFLIKECLLHFKVANYSGRETNHEIGSVEQLRFFVEQLMISPHLLPDHSKDFLLFLRRVEDPNTKVKSDDLSAHRCLRVLLGLRHLIPKETFLETFTTEWGKQEENYQKVLPFAFQRYHAEKKEAWSHILEGLDNHRSRLNAREIDAEKEKWGEMSKILEKLADQTLSNKTQCLQEIVAEIDIATGKKNDEKLSDVLSKILNVRLRFLNTLKDMLQRGESYRMFIQSLDNEKPADIFDHAEAANVDDFGDVESIETFQENLVTGMTALTQHVEALRQESMREPEREKKKILLMEAKQHALQLLVTLPPPGTEGAFGVPSIWYDFPKKERKQILKNIHQLEHLIWESNMKRAHSEMSGKERFLLIKAQTVRQAIIRAEVNEHQADPECKDGTYLQLNRCTMDTSLANQLLSQDLTACLSENAAMEKDLLAVYHFVLRDHDQGMGIYDGIQPSNRFPRKPICKNGQLDLCKNQENQEFSALLEQIQKADIYYHTASDPDFTLYSCHAPTKGVAFFQAKPDLFLAQDNLDLSTDNQEAIVVVGDENHVPLAEAHLQGHPDFSCVANMAYSEEEKEWRMRQKSPFLPTVDNELMKLIKNIPELEKNILGLTKNIPELRTLRDFDTWISYVSERTQEESLAIPPKILQELFLIRQTAPRLRGRVAMTSSYAADTAIRALSFLTNEQHQTYLEYDFVQQFLKESLFGAFLMQQAIVEHPVLMLNAVVSLTERLDEAIKENHYERIGFFSDIIQQLHSHVQFTQTALREQGWFSGLINGSLPVHFDKKGGLFGELFTIINKHREKPRRGAHFGGAGSEEIDVGQVLQPLPILMKKVDACVEALNTLSKRCEKVDLATTLCAGEEGKRPVDQATNPQAAQQLFTHLLKTSRQKEGLAPDAIPSILLGYQKLCDSTEGLSSEQEELIHWVRETILPVFHQLDARKRSDILHALNPFVGRGEWKQVDEGNTYQLNLPDRAITFDLYSMSKTGARAGTRQNVPIPDVIIQRADVQQALRTKRILATKSRGEEGEMYRWEEEGQQFTVAVAGIHVTIKRTINEGLFAGEYTFQPLELGKGDTPAHALLADNGIWRKQGDAGTGWLLTQGRKQPTERSVYRATIRKKGQREKIVSIASSDQSCFVSRSLSFAKDEGFPFAEVDTLIPLIDPNSRKPVEVRLKNSHIAFKREGKHWTCQVGNDEVGTVRLPKNVSQLPELFGDQWGRYVIPLEKGGKTRFLLLPYGETREAIPQPEILTIKDDGSIQGSVASRLYLAHRFLLKATQAKNTTEARKLSLNVLHHLKKLRHEKFPDDAANLKHVIDLVTQNFPLSLEKIPSPVDLSLSLKMLLTIRKFRDMAANEGITTLALSPQENFEELEKITKCYEVYAHMKKDRSFALFRPDAADRQLHKTLFLLEEAEETELVHLAHQVLQEIANNIQQEDSAHYLFGSAGRVAPTLTMPLVDHLDPQFLLALLRVAKPVAKNVHLRHIVSPLPLHTLLENFWSYFVAIQDESLTPKELTFLFEKSLLPRARSSEEEERLNSLDQQARQFLLTAANVQQVVGGGQDPMKLAQEGIAYAKEVANGLITGQLQKLIAATRLNNGFKAIARGINALDVHPSGEKINEKAIPDIGRLLKDAKEVETRLLQFTEDLENLVGQGEAFVKNCQEEFATRRQAIDKLIVEKEALEEEWSDEKEEKARGKKEYEALKRQIGEEVTAQKVFLSEEKEDPVTGKKMSMQFVLHGYTDVLPLEQLRDSAKMLREFLTILEKTLHDAEDSKNFLNIWKEMQKLFETLKTSSFTPDPWIKFPETEAFSRLFDKAINDPGSIQKGEAVKAFGELLLTTGPRGMRKLAKGVKDGSFLKKIKDFSVPLAGLAFFTQMLKEKQPVRVARKERGIERPLDMREISNHPLAKKCFTPQQIEKLEANFAASDPQKQRLLVDRLNAALEQNAAILSAQTGLEQHRQRVNAVYGERIANHQKKQLPEEPVIAAQVSEGKKEFKLPGRADFPTNLAELGQKLERGKGFTYLTGQFKEDLHLLWDEQERRQRYGEELGEHFPGRAWRSTREALHLIAKAHTGRPKDPALTQPLKNFRTVLVEEKSGEKVLEAIQETYNTIAPIIFKQEHERLVDELLEQTLPEESLYAEDLKKGFERVKEKSPLPYAPVIGEDQVDGIESALTEKIERLSESVKQQRMNLCMQLKALPVGNLPKELQQLYLRSASEQQFVEAAYAAYRKGVFSDREKFDNLDDLLGKCQIDETRLGVLTTSRFNAQQSLKTLKMLREQRAEVEEGDEKALKAIEAKWLRESNRFKDLTNRCQSIKQLTRLPKRLKPHARKIIYLQRRLGLVLRKNQIDTLQEMIENPSLLKQLRMGLGKTSILLPFALEILASEGENPIGMVPKALFHTNFSEMDETTRLVFELAGHRFLFSRQDAPHPFSLPILHQISQKCHDFFRALERGEYILTTIESKASLDNKISEVEKSQAMMRRQIDHLRKSGQKIEAIDTHYQRIVEHQMVLDMLYRVKSTFEAEHTRLIIDEGDQVARANYAVNAEIGIKEAPVLLLQKTVATLFEIMRTAPNLEDLRQQIDSNNQETLTREQVDAHIKTIGKIWLKQQKVPYSEEKVDAICAWFAGEASPFKHGDVSEDFGQQLKVMRKALNSSLRASLGLKIGRNGDFDPTHQAVGIPAAQGVTSKTTKYSDPLMQLVLTCLIARYKPQGEKFLQATATDVYERIKRREEPEFIEAAEKLKKLLEREKSGENPSYRKELDGSDATNIFLRQQFAEEVAHRKLIYVSESQISRPVQHALRGCNVICLTGTATRNTEHLIRSRGYDKGMESVEAGGRESTAEVVYRLVKALPEGLKTAVETYSLDSTTALRQLCAFAEKESGINFLINQAGVCDQYSLQEIVKTLHDVEQRPIIFLNIDEEGKSAKSVLIDGRLERLDSSTINADEKRRIAQEGLYYYHTPHVRGAHFDIPTGSRGKLLLSPTVNANDRDQAAYRARELGEGHIVEPVISEKQHEELKRKYGGDEVTLAHLLKTHHQQTLQDEAGEDLAAYQLHLNGILILAADRCKEKIQLEEKVKSMGQWRASEEKIESHLENALAKARIFDLLRGFFIQGSGNRAYLRQLDREIMQGGEIGTQEHLQHLIEKENDPSQTSLCLLSSEEMSLRTPAQYLHSDQKRQ